MDALMCQLTRWETPFTIYQITTIHCSDTLCKDTENMLQSFCQLYLKKLKNKIKTNGLINPVYHLPGRE